MFTRFAPWALALSLVPALASAQGLRNGRFVGEPTLTKVVSGALKLKTGASGAAVKRIQQALLDMGYSMKPYPSRMTRTLVGGVDGVFGGQLTKSLRNFQWHASTLYPTVRADGVLDAATMVALDALSPPAGMVAWAPGLKPRAPIPVWRKRYRLRAVIVKNEHRTFFFDDAGNVLGIFSNAVGARATQTDSGIKMVVSKLGLLDAQAVGKRLWQDPRAFGDRILNLSWATGSSSGEEMHGTYAYDRMGEDVSHGCARHYNEDIIWMFDRTKVRDMVAIVDSLTDANLFR